LDYRPDGPYTIQSGKRKGKSLETLMFQEYGFVKFMYVLLKEKTEEGTEKNELHRHLEWLLQKGEDREAKKYCPFCKERKAKYFSVRFTGNDFALSSQYICCESHACFSKIIGLSGDKRPIIYPFKFSVLERFKRKADEKRVIKLLKDVFLLPEKIGKENAFKFFSE